ncbi:peptidase C15 [Nostoc sp. MBR 210]|uniref:Peptidase C15 n=1 Tax=Nostoc spongiaeforme FACHB-130 TaxID=1357510 RepID=A0ABR8G1T2_9NOSO|nr:peptidase C15 [Nostoc spongiaeforme]MBD2597156.1 peptidase C15 [Nostoc spongiaeforme FACHB-130]OCQ89898.1 peptidase C15 [Nostoc sp. MBR 210]
MKKRFLLTSFDTWLRDQDSNSSDDLLQEVSQVVSLPHDLKFLRLLPVDVMLASSWVIQKVEELQPDYIICCGMAASRQRLSVEEGANQGAIFLPTAVNLEKLVLPTVATDISSDCGKFVCEGLYYAVLDYLQQSKLSTRCIFVHVPVLNQENLLVVLADFLLIINNLALI